MNSLQLPEAKTSIDSLPDSFHLFWRALNTEAEKPLGPFPLPARSSLPSFPDHASLPPQESPFEIPGTLEELIRKLQSPVQLPMVHLDRPELRDPAMPQALLGGETRGQQRVIYIIKKGIASSYHLLSDDVHVGDAYHGLLSYLALGCITARQVHQELLKLECGTDPGLAQTLGFGRGCSAGTESIRYHLLVLNFVRLSIIKYGSELRNLEGAGMGKNPLKTWKSSVIQDLDRPGEAIDNVVSMTQFLMGLTGFGLVDAIMRQLYITGQVTARGEEIAVGFFALYAGFDWRYGAEYVSSLSTVHDPFYYLYSSQNYAGVGPSCEAKDSKISLAEISQQVDPDGAFIRRWMPELRSLPRRKNVYRVSTTASALLQQYGLASSIMVTHEVPSAMEAGPIMETTNARRDQMENTAALARREDRLIPTESIREEGELEEFGSRLGFEDRTLVDAPLGLAEPTDLRQGPPPSSWGPSLPLRSGRGTAKVQVASTTTGTAAPPAEAAEAAEATEATASWSSMPFTQINPLALHPVTAPPPLGWPPQILPAQSISRPVRMSVPQLSDQSYYTASLPPLRPQSQLPLLPAPGDSYFLPYRQQTLSERSSPARQLPSLPAAPSPPPPPTLSSAVPHLSNTPQVPLPQEDTPRASIEDHLPPAITVPLGRNPRRLRLRIAVIPHPALAGFLPVIAEPEIIRYYIGQLRQTRFRGSSNYTFIDLPLLDNNRIHIIPCPRGVVPLRGDPDLGIFRDPVVSVPEDVDLEALDELIDEVDDDEIAVHGPRIGHSRRGSLNLRPYRGRRQPSRFNSRYR